MKKALVTVVIPNYNYADYVGEAIESCLRQTYPDIEVIVVDDGSRDDSRNIIEGFGDKIRPIFQQNAGVSAARNAGVAAGCGEFVAFLDADDVWMPEKLEMQVAAFRADPELGLVHVAVEEIDGDGKKVGERLKGGEGDDVWKDLLLFTGRGVLGGGSGAMIPRAIFEETGGFDTRLSTSADWDLYYRISRRYSVGFIGKPLLQYRVHSSNMHSNIGVMERDMLLGFEKAFSDNDAQTNEIKRVGYASLYQNLAGSFYRAGDLMACIRYSVRSLTARPANIVHFIKAKQPAVKKRLS